MHYVQFYLINGQVIAVFPNISAPTGLNFDSYIKTESIEGGSDWIHPSYLEGKERCYAPVYNDLYEWLENKGYDLAVIDLQTRNNSFLPLI